MGFGTYSQKLRSCATFLRHKEVDEGEEGPASLPETRPFADLTGDEQ